MFYPDDRRAVPSEAADRAGDVRVVDDQVVRKPAGDDQAVVRAVGHMLYALPIRCKDRKLYHAILVHAYYYVKRGKTDGLIDWGCMT